MALPSQALQGASELANIQMQSIHISLQEFLCAGYLCKELALRGKCRDPGAASVVAAADTGAGAGVGAGGDPLHDFADLCGVVGTLGRGTVDVKEALAALLCNPRHENMLQMAALHGLGKLVFRTPRVDLSACGLGRPATKEGGSGSLPAVAPGSDGAQGVGIGHLSLLLNSTSSTSNRAVLFFFLSKPKSGCGSCP